MDDLRLLKAHSWKYCDFPEPGADPGAWEASVQAGDETWEREVRSLLFIDSVADAKTELPQNVLSFECKLCLGNDKQWFPSERALAMHHRVAHRQLSDIKRYADGDGIMRHEILDQTTSDRAPVRSSQAEVP